MTNLFVYISRENLQEIEEPYKSIVTAVLVLSLGAVIYVIFNIKKLRK